MELALHPCQHALTSASAIRPIRFLLDLLVLDGGDVPIRHPV